MPLEIERRFLVSKTRVGPQNLAVRTDFIVQTYLLNETVDVTERVRRSTDGYTNVYTHTLKVPVSPGVSDETELIISPEEYGALLKRADPRLNDIHKTRYTFEWEGLTWELDRFQGPLNGLWILEIELEDLHTHVGVPPFITVAKEITGDRLYSNRALSECQAPPL